MDLSFVISFLQEIIYLLIVLGAVLLIGLFRGVQQLINLILGLYLALLIALEFPYYKVIDATSGETALAQIAIFMAVTLATTLFFNRLLPTDAIDRGFSDFGRKFLYALGAATLIMIYSYHVLPVTSFITPGSPIAWLFASEAGFFWWLLFPLLIIYWFRN